MITKDQVLKALDSLEAQLEDGGETRKGMEQPEGGDMGWPADAKKPMSSESKKVKAKKVAKADDEEEGEGEMPESAEAEEGEEEGEEKAMKKKAHKSFTDLPEEVQTKIDVSEFLKSLVNHTGEVIQGLSEHVAKSDLSHEARYSELGETLQEIVKSQAKIGVVLKALCERVGIIENAPARGQRADQVVKSTAPVAERQFQNGLAEEAGEKVFKGLSENPIVAKSQLATALCDLVKKGEATDLDVIGFESGGYIRPELVSKLKGSLS